MVIARMNFGSVNTLSSEPVELASLSHAAAEMQLDRAAAEVKKKALDTLHPEVRERAERHIEALVQAGFEIILLTAWESIGQRAELFARGRARLGREWRVTDRALVVTRTELGWHPFGLAYDLILTLGGRPPSTPAWQRAGELGELAGLSWRKRYQSRWSTVSHFQHVPAGIYPSQLRRLITRAGPNLENLPDVWAALDERHSLA